MNVKSIGEFLEILSLAFPTLSGIVCTLGTEMEVDAGNMAGALGRSSRKVPCRGREIGGIAAAWSNGNTAGAWKLSGRDLSVFWRIFQWRVTAFYCGVSFILLGTQIATYVIHFL